MRIFQVPFADPDFRYMLFQVLSTEAMVAVVRLGPSWFGLVAPYAEGRRLNLMLSVLDHEATVPWLGSIAAIVDTRQAPKKKSIWVRRAADSESAHRGANSSPIEPSYASDRSLTSPTVRSAKQLQLDLQRVLRLGRGLPAKLALFKKEVNKLRATLVSFGMSAVLVQAMAELEKIQQKATVAALAGDDDATTRASVIQVVLAEVAQSALPVPARVQLAGP